MVEYEIFGKTNQSGGSRHGNEKINSPKGGLLILDTVLIVVRVLKNLGFNKYLCIHTSFDVFFILLNSYDRSQTKINCIFLIFRRKKMSFNPISVILSQNKLIGKNFTEWKCNLNIVLTSTLR